MKIKAELTFPGELKNAPLICSLCKQFNIVLRIEEASFSTDTGWAILIFEGQEEEVKKVFEFLKTNGVRIENEQHLD